MVRQEVTPEQIGRAIAELRANRDRLPNVQQRTVKALARMADFWRDPGYSVRRRAELENAGFPFAMVLQSLEALLASFSEAALWNLIECESARDIHGGDVIGHVVASNTPLLSWTSLARALLVQSASLVKLPTHPVSTWARYFHESLKEVDRELASLIKLCQWKGGDKVLDAALCRGCDLVVAYGDDETISALKHLCEPDTPLVGYGHRVSFGIVPVEADRVAAAEGFAKDVLLFDQGGCLSPHCLFVEGDSADALSFAELLSRALRDVCRESGYVDPAVREDSHRAAIVREERALAHMEPGVRVWEDYDLHWTVITAPNTGFRTSRTHGIVYVVAFQGKYPLDGLASMKGHLQGAGIAVENAQAEQEWKRSLEPFGVSYLCPPGKMQCPPLSWRQNGQDILRSLVR